MKQYKTILFDLDGTLTDSASGITNSIMYALEKFGINVNNRTELYPFIGPPLLDSFITIYHFSEEKARQAVHYYHEYFSEKGMYENRIYDGIPEMLAVLKDRGKILAVASAKPECFVKTILNHFDLSRFFDFIGGTELHGTRIHKEQVIQYVLNALAITDKNEVVMVGDRRDDIQGAQNNGLDSVGVLYGFGSREELVAADASYLAKSVKELQAMLQ